MYPAGTGTLHSPTFTELDRAELRIAMNPKTSLTLANKELKQTRTTTATLGSKKIIKIIIIISTLVKARLQGFKFFHSFFRVFSFSFKG